MVSLYWRMLRGEIPRTAQQQQQQGEAETETETYDFEELALEGIFPSFALQLFGDLENLIHGAGNHTHRLVCLRDGFCGRRYGTKREGYSPSLLPS